MLVVAIAVHAVAFALYSRSRVLSSLAIWAVVALAIGTVIPFAFVVSWALMDRSEKKKGFEKPDSFIKKCDEDWD